MLVIIEDISRVTIRGGDVLAGVSSVRWPGSQAFPTTVQVIEYLKSNPEMAKQSYDQAQRIMQV